MSTTQLWVLCFALLHASIVLCHETSHNASSLGLVVEDLSLDGLDQQLQACPIVQALNAEKAAAHGHDLTPTTRLFDVLFPYGPAANSLLATLYISGPPNFLLALCPTDIDPASLSIMVAFAVGGLLGDTLFHLLPEIFLGEEEHGRVRLVLVEPNRNLLLGLAILVGFVTFVVMDKTLRIATGGGAHDHGHGHGHSHAPHAETTSSSSSAVDGAGKENGTAKSRNKKKKQDESWQNGKAVAAQGGSKDEVNPSVKLAGYLNLIADFTHNITDGLAMAASFYASPAVGASTTLAVFMHEIPHEVGDFALLVQSGFSKRKAMGAQFVTAIGAFLGTLIGIAIQELGGGGDEELPMTKGLWGTSLTWGDMLLPFTAGTFLYVGTVAVIPELLETGPDKALEIRKTLGQFSAIAVGALTMLYISWHD